MITITPGTKFSSVDEYHNVFPAATKKILKEVRRTIKKAAPQAEEVISYNMPAFKFHGMVVFYAGYKNHIGFYPTASGIKSFQKELSSYKSAKGSVQFPIGEPMPVDLISKIVKFKMKENAGKEQKKGNGS